MRTNSLGYLRFYGSLVLLVAAYYGCSLFVTQQRIAREIERRISQPNNLTTNEELAKDTRKMEALRNAVRNVDGPRERRAAK